MNSEKNSSAQAMHLDKVTADPAAVLDAGTPGIWRVRKREVDGELRDCFVAAPDCQGLPYDAEILGDDEYRDGIARKLADCELIVKAVNNYRAALASLKTVEGADLDSEITEHIAEADALCRKLYNQYGYAQPAQDAREWIQIAKQLLAETAQAAAAQAPAAATSSSELADAYLAALLRYTGGFYENAMAHGMKRGETADAVAHIEKAARALHSLATANAAEAVQDDYKAWYIEAMKASNEAGFVGMSAADTIRALAATQEQAAPSAAAVNSEALKVINALREWVMAVPADVAASLPAMPGIDADWMDGVVAALTARVQAEPVAFSDEDMTHLITVKESLERIASGMTMTSSDRLFDRSIKPRKMTIRDAMEIARPQAGIAGKLIARISTAPQATKPYSMDQDPQGIRALVAVTIEGAIARGLQGGERPPEGHWLTSFYEIGAKAQPADSSKEPLTRYCPACGSIGPVGSQCRDCCPDGIQARLIPDSLAKKCHDTFRLSNTSVLNVQTALRDYHYALDTRQHGDIAADKAIKAIQRAFDMPWIEGQEAAARTASQGKVGAA